MSTTYTSHHTYTYTHTLQCYCEVALTAQNDSTCYDAIDTIMQPKDGTVQYLWRRYVCVFVCVASAYEFLLR
jgi:hypothetical protein